MFDLIPFRRGTNDIFTYFNELEKNFLDNFNFTFPNFRTDIVDKGDHFVLEAELPGFRKEDINIEVDNNRLTIHAKHEARVEDNKENYIRKERRFGSFTRSFDVSNIKTDEIKAEYNNGVLILDLPKKDPNQFHRRINIQ
ncbi:Hsp20/alpha crystallin family protein [Tepidibacillus fermentans]|uniref:HSP20 family protein n=1 Tax=Tepidibacillus fermentans TaxID=1281767 RepID=A0A4R3KK37_9BACI|nr:Hsp20/alpha crystallin family protein [Tepidibacillus fermentans]TCS83090.1 HSP20 family protein [Tepidibacillus fermentans]